MTAVQEIGKTRPPEIQAMFGMAIGKLNEITKPWMEDDERGYHFISGLIDENSMPLVAADMYIVAAVLLGLDNQVEIGKTAGTVWHSEYCGAGSRRPAIERLVMTTVYRRQHQGVGKAWEDSLYFSFHPQGMSSFVGQKDIQGANKEGLEDLLQAQTLWQAMHDLGLPVGDPYLTPELAGMAQAKLAEINQPASEISLGG